MLVYVAFVPVKLIRVNVECVMTLCAILGRYVCVHTVHCINSHSHFHLPHTGYALVLARSQI